VTTQHYKIRDFHIISDAKTGFKNIDAICQFQYKDHQISASTAGISAGGCHNEVNVYRKDNNGNNTILTGQYNTVEEAIDAINAYGTFETK
jgi:hypothetical protein